MIFLDTNVFLRYMAGLDDQVTETMRQVARDIFKSLERGDAEVTTSEVVLHEVCFVLGSKYQYGMSAEVIVDLLTPILGQSGFKLPPGDKRIYQRALEIYRDNPKLEFSDSVIAARVEDLSIPLATFDERLGRLPFITRWVPLE